ncbi:MAG: hypothetical protein WCS87_10000 [Methylococcaceae bacterium]
MINILALLKSQPITGLESNSIAIIEGFATKTSVEWFDPCVRFLEPPAGQHIPFVNPVEAMEILFRHQGAEKSEATNKAVIEYAGLRLRLDIHQRVRFYDLFDSELPECIPITLLLAYLQEKQLVITDIIDYLTRAVDAVTYAPIFRGPDNYNDPWSLAELPELPTAKSMIEFIPGAPWHEPMDEDVYIVDALFAQWREEMRDIAANLEKSLGESVYYFCDPNSDHDDDNIHRFLVLHWCCTFQPESPYVKFLIEVSGAKDVEELKAALIDPKSYFHPYEMHCAFFGLETVYCHFDYISSQTRKTVAIVFSTVTAQTLATSLLLQQINVDVFIVTSKELATDDWVKTSTRNCYDWTVRYLQDGQLNDPIEVLARIDELCVIADEKSTGQGSNLHISPSIEDLLWLALSYQLPTKFFFIDGSQLSNPEDCLKACKVPERVAKQDKLRESLTHQLPEIRVMADFGSSGLWDDKGRMIAYDLIALPFQLVRRLSAWQVDYDETFNPPDSGDATWWDNHEQEKNAIAKALQATLGSNTQVKVYMDDQWQWIGDFQL